MKTSDPQTTSSIIAATVSFSFDELTAQTP